MSTGSNTTGGEPEVSTFIRAVNSYVAMRKLPASWEDFLPAATDARELGIDFIDAVILRTMERLGVKEIYSNDSDFDRVKWVQRVFE
ncbi:MAG: type II toxin-antitoxin system VapC family toxin [Thaumarchaeota archaeon]|nr:type II toxin-antitoxin system VapC family toxin [Nitrososphaerota archaeon]